MGDKKTKKNYFKPMGNTNAPKKISEPMFGEPNVSNSCGENSDLLAEKLMDQQLVKQKISEEYTADIIGKALSQAEHYSSRFGIRNIINMQFNYYNLYDSGINKDRESLKKCLISLLNIIQTYYEIDGKCFPSGININNAKNYLVKLKENCKDLEDQRIFDDFISILNGQKCNFSSYFNTKNAHVDPNMLVKQGISVIKSSAKEEKKWEKKAMEEGDYPVGLQIGKDWKENENVADLGDDDGF
jgi:hypothetical protein